MHVKFSSPFRFLWAVWRSSLALVRRKPVFVNDLLRDLRKKACARCEAFDPQTRQCKVCTCFVDIKVLLSSETCPKGRW